jgi:hypothetical protein
VTVVERVEGLEGAIEATQTTKPGPGAMSSNQSMQDNRLLQVATTRDKPSLGEAYALMGEDQRGYATVHHPVKKPREHGEQRDRTVVTGVVAGEARLANKNGLAPPHEVRQSRKCLRKASSQGRSKDITKASQKAGSQSIRARRSARAHLEESGADVSVGSEDNVDMIDKRRQRGRLSRGGVTGKDTSPELGKNGGGDATESIVICTGGRPTPVQQEEKREVA